MPGSFFEKLVKYLPNSTRARVCLIVGLMGCAGLVLTVCLIVMTPSIQQDEITFTSERNDCCTVQIVGAVVHPGIYKLPDGKRIFELIEEAGGFSPEADLVELEKLDVLRVLEDGQKVEVPSMSQAISVEHTSGSQGDTSQISINNASLDALIELPYIGDKKAATIVEQRPYVSMEDFFQKNRFSATQRTELEILLKI